MYASTQRRRKDNMGYKNSEGYPDTVPWEAMRKIEEEERERRTCALEKKYNIRRGNRVLMKYREKEYDTKKAVTKYISYRVEDIRPDYIRLVSKRGYSECFRWLDFMTRRVNKNDRA